MLNSVIIELTQISPFLKIAKGEFDSSKFISLRELAGGNIQTENIAGWDAATESSPSKFGWSHTNEIVVKNIQLSDKDKADCIRVQNALLALKAYR